MKNDQYTGFEFLEESSGTEINRRDFFKTAGSGIFLLFTIGDSLFSGQDRQGRPQRGVPTDYNAFLKIGEDGRVSCYVGKIEMGQGVVTSLGQMLADELDVPLESVDMVMGDTDLCPWDMGTFGSLSTRSFGPSLRMAGAEARQVLLELGSEHLKMPADRLTTENGFVLDSTNKQHKVAYATLAKGKKIERRPTGKVSVKKPGEFKIMNKSLIRRDAQEKVTGKAKYAGDIQLPDMLHARILRPPAHDSKLISADISEAKQVDGVQVIKEGDFVAVLHRYPDVADAALSKIKAKFETPKSDLNDMNIFDHLLKVAPAGKLVAMDGNLQAGESGAKTLVEATYFNDYVAHSPMEPHTAVANVEGGKATVWASTQNPFTAKEEIAKELGFPSENVRVITPFVGGGFGGKTRNLQAIEAARLSKMTGKPVQVAYNRKEEFFFDAFRPAAVVKIKSGITEKGRISLWDYHVYFAGERGTQMFYDIPNFSMVAYNSSWVGASGSHPFLTGPWRAPGNNTNSYAREMQIDMMAEKAGMDPVEFRLQNIVNKKMLGVLKAAAQKFGWKPAKSPSGRGFGVACGVDAGTFVASIAEVEVNKSTGGVRVKRVVCAQDMGLVINPEGATIQMEGCIIMGLGYALTERVMFKGGEVLNHNFDSYEIPRFSWLPKIETVILDDKGADPQGGGEPAIVVMGGLIANAIYDAIGVRLYQLPMTPERIKEGLKKG
ncbi:MAG: molybdopterin-dependent oxidoreductase [Ignavibacteria bacterium]|nr:molybdopterin-dependent oxidoreductase [Ignavibacteria bacterium]